MTCIEWEKCCLTPQEQRTTFVFPVFTTTTALSAVFMASKVLLACPRRGGRSRQEAVSRTLRARIRDWKAGRFSELWETLKKKRERSKQLRCSKKAVNDQLSPQTAKAHRSSGLRRPSFASSCPTQFQRCCSPHCRDTRASSEALPTRVRALSRCCSTRCSPS